jgi:hypothetical protein
MRKMILGLTSVALVTGLPFLATPAQAASWCSRIEGHLHCMYHTHAQCRASVSGRMGDCVANPHRR